MRPALAACLCLVWAASAWSQGQLQPVEVAAADTTELQRIEATRVRETAVYDAEEAACYQRFAVSGCIKDIQSQRRAMLANLRRQEAALHERQFADKGAEQRRLSAQKAQERQQQQSGSQTEEAAARTADKLQAQKDKLADHAAKSPVQGDSAPAANAAAPPLPTAGLSAADQSANRASYARKQAEAEKKRAEIAKRLAGKGKPAAPLPLPQ
jgi:hypothetical protein